MANIIDILINAKWTGGGAVSKASGDLRQFGNNATASSIELAAVQARSNLLNTELGRLGERVARGNITIGQATEEYNKFKSELVDVGTTAPKTGINVAALATKLFAVTAAITAATVAAKKFGQAIVESAELEATVIRFDRLAESIGTTGDALRFDLSVATTGLISDMEAMASATDFLALGLAKNTDEAIRLTSVASQLGFNMNQLVLTLTNQTTMRFDALGVSVDGFEDKVKALEEAGYDANEAFKLAFLEQAEEQVERVGGRAETTAGQIDILSAALKNLKDEAKLSLIEGLGPFFDLLTSGIITTYEAQQAVLDFNKAVGDIKKEQQSIDDLREALHELSQTTSGEALIQIFTLTQQTRDAQQAVMDFAVAVTSGTETLEEQKDILESYGFVIGESTASLEGFRIEYEKLNEALKENELAKQEEIAKRSSDQYVEFWENIERASTSLEKTGPKIPLSQIKELAELLNITNAEAKELLETIGQGPAALEFFEKLAEDPTRFFEGFEDIFGGIGPAIGGLQEAATEQIDLWLGFQADLTDISVREGELREQAEADYEKRRTEIVNDFGARRAQEEANWQRQIARQDEQLRRNIEQVQEDSGDRQAELREDANRRLANLERDHLDRMREIIESADLQLADAASRLDAKAVAAIERGREESLNNEKRAYTKQREEINRELQERLEAEREAAEERIEEMKEFHEERQKQEEEDRQYRLQQEQLAHDERLREFDQEHQDRLTQIREQARDEERQRDIQYQSERMQLNTHWQDKETLTLGWMNDILDAEASWWSQRMGLVGGGTADGVDSGGTPGVPPPSGGGDTGTGGNKPSRFWLEQQVIGIAKPNSTDAAFTWYQWMKGRSDAELAAWIERHSDIDVPGYALGTLSARGGLAMVGEMGPELVALPGGSQVFDSVTTQRMMSRISVENISISVLEAKRPGDTAREVRREMTRIFEELAR